MSEPKIYTKNYISAADVFTISHGPTAAPNLYDRDNDSKWVSVGANADTTAVTIEVEFYEGVTAVNRTISCLMLLNHNLENWKLEYWNGAAWVELASDTDDAAANTVASFNAVTTSKVKLTMTHTQAANAEKYIGELIVCALTLDVGRDMDSYAVQYAKKSKQIELGDGSNHETVTRFTANRTGRYVAKATFSLLTTAAMEALQAVNEVGEPFLWVPESVARPSQVFFVRWSGGFSHKYVNSYKGAGHAVSLDLKEV